MSTSTQQFVSIPELLSCLGRVVKNRCLLYHLCLTSKSFKFAFTPFLYEEIVVRADNSHILINHLDELLENKSLKHVKRLDFYIPSHGFGNIRPQAAKLCQHYNGAIQALLLKVRRLTAFRWSGLPLYSTTVSTLLRQCPNLQCILLSYPMRMDEIFEATFEYSVLQYDGLTELHPLFGTQHISPFANLTSLDVHEIQGDIVSRRKDLAKVLIQSPNLRALGLSLHTETVIRLHRDELTNEYLGFLTSLVSDYRNSGGKPLKLSQLVLGLSVLLWEDEEKAPASYLGDLTDLTFLEDVFIANEIIDNVLWFEERDGIAWWTFTPSICPNLHIFCCYNMSDAFNRWLQDLKPGYLSQVHIYYSLGLALPDFDEIVKGNGVTLSAVLILYANESVQYGDYASLKLRTVQALSIGLWPIAEEVKAKFLNWIGEMTCLEQLSYREAGSHPERNGSYYENLGCEIALRNKRLKYLKLEEYAWRIWHESAVDGESSCRLEMLDRFDQMEIEAFQTVPNHWSAYSS